MAEEQRDLDSAEVPAAIITRVQQRGLAQRNWPDGALTLLLRARWAAQLDLLALPALDEAHLQACLHDWLAGFLHAGSDIDQLPLQQGLAFYLGFDARQKLDQLVLETLCLPSGRRVAVDYQGTADKAGRTPLSMQLLSPSGQPLVITRDLAYFWREVYPQVRRKMRGRYGKHPWPEDPLAHQATASTNRRLRLARGRLERPS